MNNIDIDAVIELEKALRGQGPAVEDRADRVGKLTDIIRKSGVHVTSANAVALLGDEDEAMEHLLGYMKIVKGWGENANNTEMVQAIHVLQGFIVQRMLNRLNPELWTNWYKAVAR